MKRILLLTALLIISFSFTAQTSQAETYYSQGLPDPTSLANWNTIRSGGGTTPPNYSTDANIFVIQAGYDVTINTSWVVAGNGSKLHIESGATLTANGPVGIGAATTFQIDNSGKYIHNHTGAFASTILQGIEAFADNSIFEFQLWGVDPPAEGIRWGNVVFNSSSTTIDFQCHGFLEDIRGNFEVKNTAAKKVSLVTYGFYDINIYGSLVISGGTLDLASDDQFFSNRDLTIYGNFIMSGGTLTQTHSERTNIIFKGSGAIYSKSGGSITGGGKDWIIDHNNTFTLVTDFALGGDMFVGGILDAQDYKITGSGGVYTNVEGRFKTSHPLGVKGNLVNSGDKYFSQAGIEYNGTANQSMGLAGISANSIRYLTVSNTNGTVTADANMQMDFGSSFTTNAGSVLNMGNFILNFPFGGAAHIAGTLKTSNSNGFNNAANTTIIGAVELIAGCTIEYTSGSAQNITGRSDYSNITFSGGGVKTFVDSAVVAGAFTVNSGETILLDTHSLAGTGINALFAGTGTISLNTLTLITGFNNNFEGNFYIFGSNASIPDGIYKKLTIDGTVHLTGVVIVDELIIALGTLSVGPHTLVLSNPIQVTPENLITDSTSSLNFIGSSPITIPSSVTRLGGLSINLTGGVSVVSDINVSGIMRLTNGMVYIGSHRLSADSIVGGSATHYVRMDSLGRLGINNVDGPAFFPIGNSSYNPCIINNTGGVPDNFLVGIQDTIVNPTPDNNQGVNRQWNISEGTPGGSNAFITLQWATADQGHSVNHTVLAIGHFINGAYDGIMCDPVAGSNPWTITTSTPVTSFSPFIIANETIAPVELATFTSNVNVRNVTLSWSTVMEENNSGFDVERKTASTEWTKIGNVQGHGTINVSNNYSYNDRNLSTGNYSYRLKQIDYNGNFEYFNLSGEVEIGVPTKFDLSQNYPNPFNPSTTINYELPSANFVSMKIYDMTGREVMQLVNEVKDAGYYTVKFNASMLSSGMYFYKIQAGNFVSTKKMMLVK